MFLKKIIKEYKAREMKRQDKLTKSVADNHPSSSSSLPTTSKNKLAVLETLIRYIQNGVVDVKILEDRLSSTTAASTATATSSVSAIASTPRGGKSSAAKSRKASASVGIDDGDNGDDAIISALLRETIDVEKELEPYKQNCTQLRLKVYPPSDVAINRKGMELEDIGDLNEKTHTLPTSTMTTIEEAVMGRSTTQGDNDGRSSRWHPYSRSTWRQAPFGCIARRRQGGVKSNTLQPVYSVGSLDIPATDTGFRIIVDDSYGMCALSNGVVEEGVVVEGHVEGDEQQSETVATTARDLHHQVDYSALVESLKQSIVLF